ncbi:response regulator [Falsiroseomonas sp. HC035]|uniref:sensor histidine kinase n=1 Tax=Falsiroseomonas sp. HC035 TaxID=3390999 RepID=UPI003D316439
MALPSAEGAEPARAATSLALLIVDDEVHVAGELADAAMDEGYAVHVANSAAAALEAVARHPEIGVMISDIRMPGCDGLQLTRQVLAMRREAEAIEVILITGHATLDDAITAVRTGAFDFVRKPFRLREILEATSRALARSIGRRRVAEVEARLDHQGHRAPTRPEADRTPLRSVTMLQGLMHELRTPLVPILGFAELLEMPQPAAETRDFALQIGSGARLLLTTVENLITLTQLERGEIHLALRRFDASRLLRGMAEDHAKEAEAAGVTVTLLNQASSNQSLADPQGDPVLLRRALEILLRVAMQRAARGGTVALSVQHDAAGRVGFCIGAADAAMLHDAQAVDASEAALQVAPLGIHFAEAVARLHGGTLALSRAAETAFSATIILPAE